ncbi:hypothetical protein V5O48_012509 [Marasmius crinis-equi]|uniref:Uncharacterized protein n=1 Tax=Marasmius crinis-equi TaxID=585013 RepID=A0ABR3F2W5_9AGAR
MSDFFRNATDFSIGDHATFNSVQGDQYNNHYGHYHATNTNTAVVKRKPLWTWLLGKKDSEYDQYEEVKRGEVNLIREVYSHRVPGRWKYVRGQYIEMDSKCTKTISTGQVVRGLEQIQGPKMTIVSYEGPEAQKEWKRDFQQFSSTLRVGNAHLLAINQSKIPLLIFTSELIPAAQFLPNIGLLVKLYLHALTYPERLGYLQWNRLWIDPKRGVLCHGPEGPEARSQPLGLIRFEESMDTPSSVELLQDDICIRFLVGLKSKDVDYYVVRGISWDDCSAIEVVDKSRPPDCFWEPIVDHFKVNPKVVSTLTNTLVAVLTRTLDWFGAGDLEERVLLANGMMR